MKQATFETATNNKEIRVQITDRALQKKIDHWVGIRMALVTLEENKLGKGLAGLEVANLKIRSLADSYQQEILRKTIPLCARAGVDLSAWATHHFDGDEIVCLPISDVELEAEAAVI